MENIKEENKTEIGKETPPPQKSDAPVNDDATTGAGDSPGGDINDGEENFVSGKQPVTQEKGDVTAFSDGYGGDSSKLEEEMENEMKNRQD